MNALSNYIKDTEFNDKYRFVLNKKTCYDTKFIFNIYLLRLRKKYIFDIFLSIFFFFEKNIV